MGALLLVFASVQALSGTPELPAAHFEPQVAMVCGGGAVSSGSEGGSGSAPRAAQFHAQYMAENGRWVSDLTAKAGCLKDKLDILEYCKKVYPKRDITNIVEGSHFQRVTGWCRLGHKKCKGSHAEWVKPYRCLEGPFQSDALLVPESCLFDHIHNQTRCWPFDRWNATAARSCLERGLALRSFAMLLPCGISLFSGVEFVCCPKRFKDNLKPKKPVDLSMLQKKEQQQALDDDDGGSAAMAGPSPQAEVAAVANNAAAVSAALQKQQNGNAANTDGAAAAVDEDEEDEEEEDEGDEGDADADDEDAEEDEGAGDSQGGDAQHQNDAPAAAPAAAGASAAGDASGDAVDAAGDGDGDGAGDDAVGEDDDDDEYGDDYDGSAGDGAGDGVSTSAPGGGSRAPAAPSPTAAPTPAAAAASGGNGGGASAGGTAPVPTPDPYFTHFDPRVEHQMYKDAQQRLEEMHREKVTKVMKDWSDLEERYQDMRGADARAADDFKRRMTARFQQTVAALEAEGAAEKRQLVAMHQQRVAAHINARKKEAMGCYTAALNDNPPNTHRVQKCLQKLLRALHKDRHHTISHYRHLLLSSFEQAEREKALTLEHLTDIDRMVNQSLQMLDRFPELRTKIGQLMEDYIQALRSKDETPGSLLAMTRDAEAAILDKYREDVAAKQEEKERQRQLEKQRKEQRKKERGERHRDDQTGSSSGQEAQDAVADGSSDAAVDSGAQLSVPANTLLDSLSDSGSSSAGGGEGAAAAADMAAANGGALAHREEPARIAHAQAHDVSHGEPGFSVRNEVYHRESKSIYFTLAFAGIALMAAVVVGVAILRRRSARSPQNQGFVEVDQAATPEERHVANMQINGYENPTYRYFEIKE